LFTFPSVKANKKGKGVAGAQLKTACAPVNAFAHRV